MKHPFIFASGLLALTACTAVEQYTAPSPKTLKTLADYAARADIRAAMVAANSVSTGECKAGNAQWLKEYPAPPAHGIINTLLAQPLSQTLAKETAQSGGQLVQLMVMDKAGCLIAAEAKTHDLEQSDEPKYQQTVGVKRRDPFYEGSVTAPLGPVDQVSQALYDDKGEAIGSLTLRWCPVKGGCGAVPR